MQKTSHAVMVQRIESPDRHSIKYQ